MVGNPVECHTTFERVVARKEKEKGIKDSDFNPSAVNSERLVDTVIGVGESGTKPSVGLKQEYMRSTPPQDPLQRDTREWSNTSEEGQSHSQPKGNGKDKGKGKKTSRKREPQTRTRLDLLSKKLDSARRVILV